MFELFENVDHVDVKFNMSSLILVENFLLASLAAVTRTYTDLTSLVSF